MGKMFEKRWDRRHGYAAAYWVDLKNRSLFLIPV